MSFQIQETDVDCRRTKFMFLVWERRWNQAYQGNSIVSLLISEFVLVPLTLIEPWVIFDVV